MDAVPVKGTSLGTRGQLFRIYWRTKCHVDSWHQMAHQIHRHVAHLHPKEPLHARVPGVRTIEGVCNRKIEIFKFLFKSP